MLSKGDLGFAYLVAVGLGIFGSFASGVLLPLEADGPILTVNAMFAILSGGIVAAGFIFAGFGLTRSGVSEERIWRVARWSAIGLGIPTALTLFLLVTRPNSLAGLDWRSVAIINIAGGGVVGIMVGAITGLKEEHTRTKALNERNMVFLRLFRHDIRNSAHIVLGHADYIEDEASPPAWSLEAVRNQINQILHLSDAARQLDELESDSELELVDLVSVVREQLDTLENSHPAVKIETSLPSEAYVRADDLLNSAVSNLLTNGVEHNNDEPFIEVTVEPLETEATVELRIRDDGPGFSEEEIMVHEQANETALRHSGGIGLWITRWIVDSYDGEISVENVDGGGAIVTVRLPEARVEGGSGQGRAA